MLKRYDDNALEESAARADELAEKDELHKGQAIWVRIAEAVSQLANSTPAGALTMTTENFFRDRIDLTSHPSVSF